MELLGTPQCICLRNKARCVSVYERNVAYIDASQFMPTLQGMGASLSTKQWILCGRLTVNIYRTGYRSCQCTIKIKVI
jgi:hypothetical protein